MRRTLAIILTTSLVLLAVLSGCQGWFGLTPEAAAVQAVLQESSPEAPLDSQSIQVLQSLTLGDMRLVFVSYEQVERNGPRLQCINLFEVIRPHGQWVVAGGNGTWCWSERGHSKPFDICSGGSGGGDRPGYSFVMGVVSEPKAVGVETIWEDGELQQATVANAAYLVVRSGQHDLVKIHALDEDGNVFHISEIP